jgi:hypothetical protein
MKTTDRRNPLLERALEQFPPPEDVFGALLLRREARRRRQRATASIVAVAVSIASVWFVVGAFDRQPPMSRPQDRVAPASPVGSPSEWATTGHGRKWVGTVTLTTEGGCRFEGRTGPMPTHEILFEVNDRWEGDVAFDIGRLADGHTFTELAADIAELRRRGEAGWPGALRPDYLQSLGGWRTRWIPSTGFVRGDPSQGLLVIRQPPRHQVWSASDYSATGTWAVICYRGPAGGGSSFEPVAVVGPVTIP